MSAWLLVAGLLLSPELEAATAAAEEARAHLKRDGGELWGRRLDDIPWCFVAGGQAYLTVDPGDPSFTADGKLWRGALPSGMSPANTAVTLAGRRCAMVVLPLPGDRAAATRLLIHEAFHVAQPEILPLPPSGEGGAGAALLERPEGRVWLILEWRALARALELGGAEPVRQALVLRARRYAEATPEERVRERLLDLGEGLAEYTAWKLGGGDPAELARRLRVDAPRAPSFVRSFPYATGPAYGLVLDVRRPGWRAALRGTPDLQALLSETLPVRGRLTTWLAGAGDLPGLRAAAVRVGFALGMRAVASDERARWRAHERELAGLQRRFVDGPTLRVRPGKLRVSFDPNRQTSLGDRGTVMAGLVWKDDDGSIAEAPGGALVVPDWSELRLPLDGAAPAEGRLTAPLDLAGVGWKLHLSAGWTLRRDGGSVVASP